jgi:hypothetical protein
VKNYSSIFNILVAGDLLDIPVALGVEPDGHHDATLYSDSGPRLATQHNASKKLSIIEMIFHELRISHISFSFKAIASVHLPSSPLPLRPR